MITAWDVYWVMQLDSITTALGLVGSVGACLSLFIGTVIRDHASKDSADWLIGRRLQKLTAVLIIFLIPAFLVPSSKTMAAMLIIPKITSDEVVSEVKGEARELYNLAKELLKKPAGK